MKRITWREEKNSAGRSWRRWGGGVSNGP